ncbi:hypothetical protein [Bacillus cereus group sp. N21]|uniref:hypothetical protein n=1 Tax=Bacillus cereus group sp. N21 TaxID=2794591 RepID=UPI0018F6CC4F|nr:hypothetical protein [Bacillus cereus group sp. N21]MBJ8027271.1 hypothetical protein [Bacillus cereus group sp. N21]
MNYFLVVTHYVRYDDYIESEDKVEPTIVYQLDNYVKSKDDAEVMKVFLKEQFTTSFNEAFKVADTGKLINVEVKEIDEMSYMRQHFSKENKRKQATRR